MMSYDLGLMYLVYRIRAPNTFSNTCWGLFANIQSRGLSIDVASLLFFTPFNSFYIFIR